VARNTYIGARKCLLDEPFQTIIKGLTIENSFASELSLLMRPAAAVTKPVQAGNVYDNYTTYNNGRLNNTHPVHVLASPADEGAEVNAFVAS